MVSRYQSEPGEEHWIAVKHILKYLRRLRGYMLVYQDESLEPIGCTDSDFQADIDSRKYHLICEIVNRGDVAVSQIASEDNLADPFTG